MTKLSYRIDNSKGAAYNADADRDSWHQMEQFLKRLF